MSPSPLFLRQNNANLPKNQHITQPSLETQQDLSVKDDKDAILMASLPSSSSSSSNLHGKKQEVVAALEAAAAADDDDKQGGYCTPSSPESRIPAAVHCPPAPKKPKVCRRTVVRRRTEGGQKVTFFEGLGLVVFEEIGCCRRRRRSRSVRGRLAIAASAAETDENRASAEV